jgi:predicted GIY-YIG superfamily endonuclease
MSSNNSTLTAVKRPSYKAKYAIDLLDCLEELEFIARNWIYMMHEKDFNEILDDIDKIEEKVRDISRNSGFINPFLTIFSLVITDILREKKEIDKETQLSKNNNCVVYVIHSLRTGLYKIGFTKDLTARFNQLKGFIPGKIEIVLKFSAQRKTETKLHREYKHKQVNSEWFNLDKKDLQQIEKLYP